MGLALRRDSSGAGVVSRWISFEGQTGKRREKPPILPPPPSPPFLFVTGLLILDAPPPPLHFPTLTPSVPHTSPCSPRGSQVTPLAPLVYTSVHVRFILSDLRFATALLHPSPPPPIPLSHPHSCPLHPTPQNGSWGNSGYLLCYKILRFL